jgi:hypothetical protein
VDAQYEEVNSSEVGNHDAEVFREYCTHDLKEDAIKFLSTVMK